MPPLYGVCPSCQAKFPLSAALQDAEARRALTAAVGTRDKAGLPGVVLARLIPYLDLHAPASGKAMAWAKVARLIDGLMERVLAPRTRRDNGPELRVAPEHWAAAMDAALAARDAGKLSLPLEDHGWITTVAYRMASQAQQQAEARRESQARGETPIGQHPSHRPAEIPPPAPFEPLKRGPGGLAPLSYYLAQIKGAGRP